MTLSTDFDAKLAPNVRELISQAAHFAQTHLRRDTRQLTSQERQALLQAAVREGLAAMEVPQEYGGQGASFAARMRVCETLAHQDGSFAFALVNHHNVMARIAMTGSDALRDAVLKEMMAGTRLGCTAMTEPQSGSDFSNMQTHAKRVDGGWVINGEKAWITNAAYADVVIVYAQTDPQARTRGIGGFVIQSDMRGFERLEPYDANMAQAMGVGGLRFTDCFVPDEHVIYPAPDGFMAAMRGVNQARIHVAAINVGMVSASLQTALQFCSERKAFGQSILAHQGAGWALADVATTLAAMQLLLYEATSKAETDGDVQMLAAMAKKFSNENTLSAIAACQQAMGAQGLRDRYVLARHLACARAMCYADGSIEMMNERIRHLLARAVESKAT